MGSTKHSVAQLTTWELRDEREILEKELAGLTRSAAEVKAKLDAVIAEQDERAAAREPRADSPNL